MREKILEMLLLESSEKKQGLPLLNSLPRHAFLQQDSFFFFLFNVLLIELDLSCVYLPN